MERKWRLVVVGNGMAGINTVEQLLKLTDRYDITVIGEEPHPNYNRILLSYVLEGSKKLDDIVLNPYSWYEEAGITLLAGEMGERIDTERRVVLTDKGREVPYDRVIIATGSTPFRLPVPGADKEGVVGFRSIEDCDRMIAAAGTYKTAAVIGGGLLGLEAAKGLVQLGMDVTVVHLPDYVMERQLDLTAARLLEQELERQGIRFALGKQTVEITGGERVEGLRFSDGTELKAEFVVMAVGIRPNVGIGQASGLDVNRGIVVDDWLRTSAEDVYAVGECTEHRRVCYGLVAPLFEQGAVLAKTLAGVETKPYEGSVCSTKLKVSGVDVFSTGIFLETPECATLTFHDGWKRTYRKIVLRDNIIVGAVLFGDTDDAAKLERLVKQGAAMTDELYQELTGTGGCCGSKANAAAELADDDIVCGCNGVTKKMILDAIADNGLTTLDEVKACTGASRSCGGCKPLVEQLLQHALGDGFEAGAVKQGICGCTEHSRDEIVAAIREQGLHTVHEVMAALEWKQPEGCSKCRPALNYYLGMIWPESYRDDKASRFVNERMNANIQKDGTYTVVPRMYGGMTSPEELKKIADVSLQYNVELVKMTGGQRIDLIGVKKEDVPKVWEALDMPSGYAYAKSLRTVKTCVGSRYCRFGTQDSLAMGALLERKFERIDYPAKFKMAVNGCPRNCAESCTKDIGIVGNDGGWEIYIGGNGGIKPRLADLLCKVKTDDELVEMTAAAIQYYRESANYLERTSEWVERIGLDAIRRTVVEDSEERQRLVARIDIALAQAEDPWKQVLDQPDLRSKLFEAVTLEQ
ncbi:nitrite reductase large subunit NirB [Paenibacillus dendritiformis]|uniref:Nitrite reductase [nad(P)h], large subunit n=1 Tax=Paenibacillus dendritiformis C454 TaxID=1131935 RepID=H3SD63_9BACL|nr:nitrite reductase large subunit NirB [Paenibacillus dendritiformis]EHQ62970.1 nitrite reductase [nad(p)h], large subunit [Paenibacillus dendritiformis C454]CAH8771662.1 nitrite reductase large subunit NirB [Paenibacillus dendritiformis]